MTAATETPTTADSSEGKAVVAAPELNAAGAAADVVDSAIPMAQTDGENVATTANDEVAEAPAEAGAAEETTESIEALLGQGKRDFYCGEYVKSVAALQRACEALAAKHGDLADEVAEPYLLYGRALLEVARMEADVLGGALDGVPAEERPTAAPAEGVSEESAKKNNEEEDEEDDASMIEKDALTEAEKEKISEQVIDAMTGGGCEREGEGEGDTEMKEEEEKKTEEKEDEKAEKKEDEKTEEKEDEKTEEKKDEKMEKEDEKMEGKEDMKVEGGGKEAEEGEDGGEGEDGEEEEDGEGDDSEEEDEEVGNLQIAWEVLEVARKVFERRSDWARVADCHMCLAEVGMEKEDWEQAEEDFTAACRVYADSAKLDKGDRRLATAQFQLAVACLAGKKFAEAKRAFDDSAGHLTARAAQLEGDASPEAEAERRELDELIGELRQRMSEVDEERLDFEAARRQLRSGAASIAGASPSAAAAIAAAAAFAGPVENSIASATGDVNDISGLVRKKRPAPTASPTAAAATAATAAAVNGDVVAPSPVKRRRTVAAAGDLNNADVGVEIEDSEGGDKAKLTEANGVESSAA